MADVNKYRSRITLYKRAYTSNDMGGYVQTLVSIDTIWAEFVSPAKSRRTQKEKMEYGQVYHTSEHIIRIRYRPDVSPDFKIKYNKKYYNILSVVDIDNMQDELELIVEVQQNEQ